MKKRALALLLALVLCLGLVPMTALAAELPKLPTPTNLEWGKRYVKGKVEEMPGGVSWAREGDTVSNYRVDYYNASNELIFSMELLANVTTNFHCWSDLGFRDNALWIESGSYYFTVQALGDGVTCSDSEIAKSGTWEYIKPTVFLRTPDAPIWGAWPYVTIPNLSDPYLDELYFNVWFSVDDANATDTQKLTWVTGGWCDNNETLAANRYIPEGTSLDAGYYYVHVYALSNDIAKCLNSDWSPLSAAYYYAGSGETPASPAPSTTPSTQPSTTPSVAPSTTPSTQPSTAPSTTPSTAPSTQPSAAPVAVTGVELSRTKLSLKENETTVLTATVKPANADNKGVYWTSSDTAVLSVSDTGKLTARKEGTATVTVTTLDGNFTDTCTVTVTKTSSSSSGSSSGGGGGSSSGGGGGSSSGGSSSGGSGGGGSSAPAPTPAATKPASEKFTDVVKDSWYEQGVTYVTDKGLFQGVADGVFAPSTNMTRAMLMTVLARLDGQNTEGGDTWYSKGMDWAVAQGISDGTMPESNVTREQLVTMLHRYANPAATTGDLTAFADGDSVSGWAVDAMAWAVSQGIVTGKDGSRLDPQGTATRAEVATIIQRFVALKK